MRRMREKRKLSKAQTVEAKSYRVVKSLPTEIHRKRRVIFLLANSFSRSSLRNPEVKTREKVSQNFCLQNIEEEYLNLSDVVENTPKVGFLMTL
jgi:hypothetical protein